jgi:hypothetical protein
MERSTASSTASFAERCVWSLTDRRETISGSVWRKRKAMSDQQVSPEVVPWALTVALSRNSAGFIEITCKAGSLLKEAVSST